MGRARPLLFLMLAGGIAISCHRASTAPASYPSRAALNGIYQCYSVNAYYKETNGVSRWRVGSCPNYITYAAPSRADSIDTVTFGVNALNVVSRLDFFPGTFVYDSTTGQAEAVYPDRETAYYLASGGQATPVQLAQQTQVLDFNGDGQIDSLRITFVKVN